MTREPGDLPPGSSSAMAGGVAREGGLPCGLSSLRQSVSFLSLSRSRHQAAGVAAPERQEVNSMRMTGWGAITALTIAALAAAPAQAEATLETGELLITGGIEPIPTKEATSSYTIITSEEIEAHQYRTVTEVLQRVPGIHPVQQGGQGTLTYSFMRGGNSNQTLVLVNGQPVNDPSSPSDAFNFADMTT